MIVRPESELESRLRSGLPIQLQVRLGLQLLRLRLESKVRSGLTLLHLFKHEAFAGLWVPFVDDNLI